MLRSLKDALVGSIFLDANDSIDEFAYGACIGITGCPLERLDRLVSLVVKIVDLVAVFDIVVYVDLIFDLGYCPVLERFLGLDASEKS